MYFIISFISYEKISDVSSNADLPGKYLSFGYGQDRYLIIILHFKPPFVYYSFEYIFFLTIVIYAKLIALIIV